MRISRRFHLAQSQGALDFVDVDTDADVRVFIDPRAARRQGGHWGEVFREMLDSHFEEVESAIGREDRARLHELMATGEPNETHLGWSVGGRSRGRGLREQSTDNLARDIINSNAAEKGLLSNLEDLMLLVEGVGPDLVSDQATHVLKGALIGYTQGWCRHLGIPLEMQHVPYVWHPGKRSYDEVEIELPRTNYGPLILVPKSIVRYHVSTDTERFYNGFLAPLLERQEISRGSDLVSKYKNGREYVSKEKLREKYPLSKPAVVEYVAEFPRAIDEYRSSEDVDRKYPPLDHVEFSQKTGTPEPNFEELYEAIVAIAPGSPGAHAYHMAVQAFLSAVLWPVLGNARIEDEIHEGRKRIDICYDNIDTIGFFRWLSLHKPSMTVAVECKNYKDDVANAELDQVAGRFSRDRGIVGILACRKLRKKEVFLQRCRDTSKDGRGFILAVDDRDLHDLMTHASETSGDREARLSFPLLRARWDALVK